MWSLPGGLNASQAFNILHLPLQQHIPGGWWTTLWRRASSLRMRSCFAPPLGILTLWWVEMIHSHNGVGVGCWWMAIRIPWKSNQVGLRTTIFFNSKGLAWFKRNHHFLDGCWLPGYIFCIPRWKQQVWTPWFIPWWMAVYVYTYIYIYTLNERWIFSVSLGSWMKGEKWDETGYINIQQTLDLSYIYFGIRVHPPKDFCMFFAVCSL